MKILHVNHSDSGGGAARAAYRLHKSLGKIGIESRMLVNIGNMGDRTVISPKNKLDKLFNMLRPHVVAFLLRAFKTQNKILHSLALLPSGKVRKINHGNEDLIHLHWINGEMLSISDIGKINKPVVWTLHDMWAFCGAEHVSYDKRWEDGYSHSNRDVDEIGLDLNRWVWKRKLRNWTTPRHIVTPSSWMAQCVKKSKLMGSWPVSVIPNPIDIDKWAPIEKEVARLILGIKTNGSIKVVFGAMGDVFSYHKGFDLLIKALEQISKNGIKIDLLVYGQLEPSEGVRYAFPVKFLGRLHDDVSLRLLFSSADVVVVPSRLDNFPSAATEAMACGTPIVCFEVCGLIDIVTHKEDGYLARPFDVEDFAAGVLWVINNNNNNRLGLSGRKKAHKYWASQVVAKQYENLYSQILSSK